MKGFRNAAADIAKSSRPYVVVFDYATAKHEQGTVYSTHKSYDLARKAAQHSGYETFLSVRDARDYG